LILIDTLSWEKEKEKRKERKCRGGVGGAFFPGLDMPCWLCNMGFLQLLGAIKK
jgi:hypothetical protein